MGVEGFGKIAWVADVEGNCEKEQWTGSVVVEVGKLVAAGKVHSVECMEKPRAGVGMLQKMG